MQKSTWTRVEMRTGVFQKLPCHSSPARVTSVVRPCIPAHCSAEGHHLWAGTVPLLLLLYLCKNLLHKLQMVRLLSAYFCLFLSCAPNWNVLFTEIYLGLTADCTSFNLNETVPWTALHKKALALNNLAVILLYLLQIFWNINTLKNIDSGFITAFPHICTADSNHQTWDTS